MRIGEWIREVETGTRLLPMRILNPAETPEQVPVIVEPEVEPAETAPTVGADKRG